MAEEPPAAERHVRWRRAAETLAAARSELPVLLAERAGLPAPSGTFAAKLITDTLDTLDVLVPLGSPRTANDLVDAVRDLGFNTFPPIPHQIAAAQTAIVAAISCLEPTELHNAAAQLGLRPDVLEWGVRVTLVRARRRIGREAAELLADVEFDEVGYADVDSEDYQDDDAGLSSMVKTAVHSLRADPPIGWDPTEVESLRCALALHLALIGDEFLQASEPGLSDR